MAWLPKFALAALIGLALAGCKIEVYDKLSQRDANEMTALLLNAGVDAKRTSHKDGTFAVEVNEDDFAKAVTLIDRAGLPKPDFASMTDVLSDDRLIASPSEERARLNYALSQELSRTVSEIEGVVSARVHLATPLNDPLKRDVTRSSASVAIHHRADFGAASIVPRIKTLVANAVDGLEYDNVSIALFPATAGIGDIRLKSDDEILFENPASNLPTETNPAGEIEGKLSGPTIHLGGGFVVLIVAGQALVGRRRRRFENAPSHAERDNP